MSDFKDGIRVINAQRFSALALIIASAYWLYEFTIQDYNLWGIQFRTLTNWGLSTAIIAHYLLWRQRRLKQASNHRVSGFIAATAVLNAMVMLLYWRLFFIDPTLINGDTTPIWFQEYYLHLVGPMMILLDALLLSRVFKQLLFGLRDLLLLCSIYMIWLEFVIMPMNNIPIGTITSGLPYPFLNDMTGFERIAFYGMTISAAIVMYICFWAGTYLYRVIKFY
jgi:hypothetical protein